MEHSDTGAGDPALRAAAFVTADPYPPAAPLILPDAPLSHDEAERALASPFPLHAVHNGSSDNDGSDEVSVSGDEGDAEPTAAAAAGGYSARAFASRAAVGVVAAAEANEDSDEEEICNPNFDSNLDTMLSSSLESALDLEAPQLPGLAGFFREMMAGARGAVEEQCRPPLLSSFDLSGVAELINSGKARRIVCMVGAGISVSAGIPDFRTPGTGLYSQLERFNLPRPEAVFSLDFFRENPHPFFTLARELFPGNYDPTPTHHFMRLLHDKGLLLRCFTQNIDSLEHLAGLPAEKVVAAHGNFDGAHCIDCRKSFPTDFVRERVNGSGDPVCRCDACGGLVKPDIVFFGERLPERFFDLAESDLDRADLLIVMGTSLAVQPFANLVNLVNEDVPRLLINREKVGGSHFGTWGGFLFDQEHLNYRDALFLGTCDEGVSQLAGLLGWGAELEALVAQRAARNAAPSGTVP